MSNSNHNKDKLRVPECIATTFEKVAAEVLKVKGGDITDFMQRVRHRLTAGKAYFKVGGEDNDDLYEDEAIFMADTQDLASANKENVRPGDQGKDQPSPLSGGSGKGGNGSQRDPRLAKKKLVLVQRMDADNMIAEQPVPVLERYNGTSEIITEDAALQALEALPYTGWLGVDNRSDMQMEQDMWSMIPQVGTTTPAAVPRGNPFPDGHGDIAQHMPALTIDTVTTQCKWNSIFYDK